MVEVKDKVKEMALMEKWRVEADTFGAGCYVLKGLKNYAKDQPNCPHIKKALSNFKNELSSFATNYEASGNDIKELGVPKSTVSIKRTDGKVKVY